MSATAAVGAASGALGALPNPFGGFAPFPNTIMIPFMGAQSAVLGYQFGISYEWGKRLIKAMSNEAFNQLVTDETARAQLQNGIKQWNEQTITRFTEELPTFTGLQNTVIEETVKIELAKANRTPSAMREILEVLLGSSATELKDYLNANPDIKTTLFVYLPWLALITGDAAATNPDQPSDCATGNLANADGLYGFKEPTSTSSPSINDTTTLTFTHDLYSGSTTSTRTVTYAWDYQTHLENLDNFWNFMQDPTTSADDFLTTKSLREEYIKAMIATYGACGTPA